MQNDLKRIKDKYGEDFSHLCRELFPTILETEGLLPYILISLLTTWYQSFRVL